MNNALEVRVNKLENNTGKLAGVINNLSNSQATIAEVLQEYSGIIAEEIREQVKIEMIATKEGLKQEVKEDITQVKTDVEEIKDKFEEMPSPRASYELLQKTRKKVVGDLLGGVKTPQYILISGKIFGNLTKKLNEKFEVSSYKDIPYSKVNEAKDFISSYIPHPYWIQCMWNEMLLKYESGELDKKSSNALKRILDNNNTLMDLI